MERLIVCDLDGVLYRGEEAVPGAGEALRRMAGAGHALVFCTNNSWNPPSDAAEKIRRVTGFTASTEMVITSAMAAATLVREGPVLVVGGAGIVAALTAGGFEVTSEAKGAATVVVGLDLEISYDRLAEATLAIRAGAGFIATNLDSTFPVAAGLYPGAGSLVAALEVATGMKAEPAGKPHEAMRRLIRARAAGRPVTVVGDREDTDLAMAYAEGWDSVLVLTGVMKQTSDTGAGLVLDSIAELPDWI